MPLYDTGDVMTDGDVQVRRCKDHDGKLVMVRISREALDDHADAPFIQIASLKFDTGRVVDQGEGKPLAVTVYTGDVKDFDL